MTTDRGSPPFGSQTLTAWESTIIAFTRSLPQGWLGKRLALLFRKLAPGAMARPVDIQVFGRKMRLNGAKNIAERRLLIQPQHFDPEERQVLSTWLKPGDTVIDIGANVGAYTLYMAGLVGPSGRVFAIEPQPEVLARLKENLSFNPELTVTVAAIALGDREGEASFQLSTVNQGEAKLAADGAANAIRVPMETLYGFMTRHAAQAPAVLKIDVEGAEPLILLPFFETAPRDAWPRLIVLEQIDDRWDVDLVGRLTSMGYAQTKTTRMNVVLTLQGSPS